jgi:NAD(P)-dependent dehydrogenase (short-subunit alcohol dehydrogenase family)
MDLFAGRRVLVTGSTRGVGNATARRFLAESAEIIVHGRSDAAVKAGVAALGAEYTSGRISGHVADLGSRAATDHLVSAVGDIDILVNCAGIYEEVLLANADEAHWNHTIEVNLTAPFRLSRSLAVALAARDGIIVNVGSDSGLLGYKGAIAYAASKGALAGLTRALAVELAPRVRVLCVCPGPIDTDMMRKCISAQPDPAAAKLQWQNYSLLKRFAQPEEIAEAILFAASPGCRFQTGSLIAIDGGATAGRRLQS